MTTNIEKQKNEKKMLKHKKIEYSIKKLHLIIKAFPTLSNLSLIRLKFVNKKGLNL